MRLYIIDLDSTMGMVLFSQQDFSSDWNNHQSTIVTYVVVVLNAVYVQLWEIHIYFRNTFVSQGIR